MWCLGFGFCRLFLVIWVHWLCLIAFGLFSVFGLSLSFLCLLGTSVDFAGNGSIRVCQPSLRSWLRQCRGFRTSPGPIGVHVDPSHVTLKETPSAPSVVRSLLMCLQVWPQALSVVSICLMRLLFVSSFCQGCDLLEFNSHHHVNFEAHLPCLAVVILCLHMWPRILQASFVCEQRCDLQPRLDVITSKTSGPFPLRTIAGVAKCVCTMSAACAALTYVYRSFDHTKGFPGEGPDLCTLVSANVGSLNTNQLWKSWGADITCLQETRIGKIMYAHPPRILKLLV